MVPMTIHASAAVAVRTPSSGANAGVVPNGLVDSASGAIDYTHSSSSCVCTPADAAALDPARSSWSRSSWSTRWTY